MTTTTQNHFKLDTSREIKSEIPAPIPASETKKKPDNSKYIRVYDQKYKIMHFYKVSDHGTLHINATCFCINRLDYMPDDPNYVDQEEITKAEFNLAKYNALKALDII